MIRYQLHIIKYAILVLFLSIATLSSCDTAVKSDKALVGKAVTPKDLIATPSETFVIDTAKSQLTWIGAKMTGRHNGYFKIEEGELHLKDSLLTSGTILIDMTRLSADDKTIDQASNAKLTKHLQSEDFFDVVKYNTARFEFTGIAPYDSTKVATQSTPARKTADDALRVKRPTHFVTGNLTIKDQTKSITFPAKITLEDNLLKAKANFNIDRTHWGLVYRSDNSLGNQTIRSEVNIGFDIVARPKADQAL
ncbi:polyisoprenoid-binding protein YceI [Pontibacter aydingkolensis]|uniref:YceI family protein n=1 Tax=Pontibacter aydingkolensis TaxID=1911536 RepID=A0ABS7CQ46_9BACT|nr:YceI family protein [Pontibacter aydingkolensis]MBW7465966.1 YceI family protein [Pontibacter aydingkolensis]